MTTYGVYIDWDGDGDYTGVGEDVTVPALARSAITVRRGRDQARALAPPAAGEAQPIVLDNRQGDYLPDNTSSPLYGLVRPGREVLLQASHDGDTTTLFRGYLDDVDLVAEVGNQVLQVSAVDGLARLRGVTVTTDMYPSIRTGDAVSVLLDAAGWPADLRDIDLGATTLRWWSLAGDDAYTALMGLVAAEGPPATVHIDPATGNLTFWDRHHRLLRPASTSVQATLSDDTEPAISSPFGYDLGWRDIINDVTFSVPVVSPAAELTAVWQMSGTQAIADGETVPIRVESSAAFTGAVEPVAGTDYQLLSGAVTATLDRASGRSTTIYLTASGGAAVLTDLQLRAYPIQTVATVQVHAEDSTSIDAYGRRSLPAGSQPSGLSVHDAAAVADLIVGQRAERLPTVTATILAGVDARVEQQLTRELSDRVRIVSSLAGLDAHCYIEQIQHSFDGERHVTVLGCERIPDEPTGLLVLDDSAAGLIGTGVLGGTGGATSGMVFVLDDPSQGVLDDVGSLLAL